MAQYAVRPCVCLHWAGWHDEYVVFDETSGQTHQLDPIRAFTLNALLECPQSIDSITCDGAMVSVCSDLAHLSHVLGAVFREFVRCGLVEEIHL